MSQNSKVTSQKLGFVVVTDLNMRAVGVCGHIFMPTHHHSSQGLLNERQACIFIGQSSWAQMDCRLALVLWWIWPLLTRRENYDFLLFSTIWKPLKWVRWETAAAVAAKKNKNGDLSSHLVLVTTLRLSLMKLGTMWYQLSSASKLYFVVAWHYHAVLLVYFRSSKKCSSWPLKDGLIALRSFLKKMILSTFPFCKKLYGKKKLLPQENLNTRDYLSSIQCVATLCGI